MKVNLEVLASVNIKRKKPWPHLAWVGAAKESILLMDQNRISVLYVPSGKTKRKISKVSPLLPRLVTMNHSSNGYFLVGLLTSGELFLYHKDSKMLKTIAGIPALARNTSNQNEKAPEIFITDEGIKMVVVLSPADIYVWEMDPHQDLFALKIPNILGTWSHVGADPKVQVPSRDFKETSLAVKFFLDEVLGYCCMVSFVFNVDDKVCISSVLLRWFESTNIYSFSLPTYSAEWSMIQYPLKSVSQNCQPIRVRGAYITNQSHDGMILAVAVNQRNHHSNSIMFVSPLTKMVVIGGMKGSGARVALEKQAKAFWVCSMEWLYDDLFLVCMTKQGSVCLLSRMGEPLMIETHGKSIELGPKYFLPLHPLITIRSQNRQSSNASPSSPVSEQDIMRQRFSVQTHPEYPLILCSDGYMVTVLRLPDDMMCMTFLRQLLEESNYHLRRIKDQQRLQVALLETSSYHDSIRNSNKKKGKSKSRLRLTLKDPPVLPESSKSAKRAEYEFEQPDLEDTVADTMESSADTDTLLQQTPFKAAMEMDSGKILFGMEETLNMAGTSQVLEVEEEVLSIQDHIECCQRDLLGAWSLGATHTGAWTCYHEDTMDLIVHNLTILMSCILDASGFPVKEVSVDDGQQAETIQKSPLETVLSLFKTALCLLQLETLYQNMMPCALKLIHNMVHLFMNNQELQHSENRIKTLHGCFVLIEYGERKLNSVYSWVPHGKLIANGFTYEQQLLQQDQKDPLIHFGSKAMTKQKSTIGQSHLDMVDTQQKQSQPDSAGVEEGDDDVFLDPEGQEGQQTSQAGTSNYVPNKEQGDKLQKKVNIYIQNGQQPAKRLSPAWVRLYRYVWRYYQTAVRMKMKESAKMPVVQLLFAIQRKLHSLGGQIPHRKTVFRNIGALHYVEGSLKRAMDRWTEQLKDTPDQRLSGRRTSRLLHAILYSMLHNHQLQQALQLVDKLLTSPDIRKAMDPDKQSPSQKPRIPTVLVSSIKKGMIPVIENRAVRQVVQSLARFMAAYFSNKSLYVYPRHRPSPLPPLHRNTVSVFRSLPILHQDVSTSIRQGGLSDVWTSERALEYLLLGGLVPEAAWFASKLGDWKAAFVLSVACMQHRDVAPRFYSSPPGFLYLPSDLHPQAILQSNLREIFHTETMSSSLLQSTESKPMHGNIDLDPLSPQLGQSLTELFRASMVCGVDLAPWLLQGLVNKLKGIVCKLSPLVPEDIYLPSPPLYCPQPAKDDIQKCPAAMEEEALRLEAAEVIQVALVVLSSANVSVPAARWYTLQLLYVYQKTQKLKRGRDFTAEFQPDLLSSLANAKCVFKPYVDSPSVTRLLVAFRDLCSILWMLHARDKLSQSLRTHPKLIKKLEERQLNPKRHLAEWRNQCASTLQWAVLLIPFCRFLNNESELYNTVLSLLGELPTTPETAGVMAQHFRSIDQFEPELQERLDRILKEWQGVFMDGEKEEEQEKEGKSKNKKRSASEGEKMNDLNQPGLQRSQSGREKFPGKMRRGLTASVYYQRSCQSTEKLLIKMDKLFGSYEEFVFAWEGILPQSPGSGSTQVRINVGSRPFESEELYLQFLDTLFAVAFSKHLDAENDPHYKASIPYLAPFFNKVKKVELRSLSQLAVATITRRESMVLLTPTSPKRKSPTKKKIPRSTSSARRIKGLFRSRSFNDVHLTKSMDKITLVNPILKKNHDAAKSMDDLGVSGKAGRSVSFSSHLSKVQESPPGGNLSLTRSRRSASESDLNQSGSSEDSLGGYRKRSLSATDLATTSKGGKEVVLPGSWLYQQVDLGDRYNQLGQLLEWLARWSGKHHVFGTPHDETNKASPKKSTSTDHPMIRIRVPVQLTVQTLWVLEKTFNNTKPSVLPGPQQQPISDMSKSPLKPSPIKLPERKAKPKQQPKKPLSAVSPPEFGDTYVPISDSSDSELRPVVPVQQPQPRQPEPQPRKAKKKRPISRSQDEQELRRNMEALLERRPPPPDRRRELSPSEAIRRTPARPAAVSKSALDEDSSGTLNISSLASEDAPHRPTTASVGLMTEPQDMPEPPSLAAPTQEDAMSLATMIPPSTQPPGSQADPNLATHLQSIVRGELRRIMEIQHRGILAMLGAIDVPVDRQPLLQTSLRPQRPGHQAQTQTIQTADNTSQTPSSKQLPYRIDQSLQADIHSPPTREPPSSSSWSEHQGAPLHVDTTDNQPLGVSDLEGIRDITPLTSLLETLQNLSDQHNRTPQSRPHVAPPSGNKENSDRIPLLGVKREPEGKPELYDLSNAPRLLHLPPEDQQSLSLPPLPPEGQQGERAGRKDEPPPRMPLLRIDNSFFPSQMMRGYHKMPSDDNKPSAPSGQRNSPHKSLLDNAYQLPLLHSVYQTRRHHRSHDLPLVPPQHIIEHEQKKHQKNMLKNKHLMDFHRMLKGGSRQGDDNTPLLKADLLPEERTMRDDRNNKKRLKRRKQKLEETGLIEPEEIDDVPIGVIQVKPAKQNTLNEKSATGATAEQAPPLASAASAAAPLGEREADKGAAMGSGYHSDRETERARKIEERNEEEKQPLLNHGYAITPGAFDSYLDVQDELGSALPTNASIQYKAATATATQTAHAPKKVSFATNTEETRDSGTDPMPETENHAESKRTAEAATSITKETGTDPIKEVIEESRQQANRGENMLPPDIFLGLRFGDDASQPATGQAGKGRAFLNVVDIKGDVLNDITLSMAERQAKLAAEESQALKRRPVETPVRETPKQVSVKGSPDEERNVYQTDPLTERLLGEKESEPVEGLSLPSVKTLMQDPRQRGRDKLRARLLEMDDQLSAIEQISADMENDYKNTRLLVNTLEDLGEAIKPSDRVYPPARVIEEPTRLQPQKQEKKKVSPRQDQPKGDILRDHDIDINEIIGVNDDDDDVFIESPAKSEKKSEPRNRDNLQSTLNESKMSGISVGRSHHLTTRGSQLDMTGLSGVSDIIGEVLAQGQVKPEEVGLSTRQANRLAQKTREGGGDPSKKELQEIFGEGTPRSAARSEREREKLQEWMNKRKQERLEEYKKKLDELRELERQPYKPTQESLRMSTMTLKAMQTLEKSREENKEARDREFLEKRKKLAYQLMADMLQDELELPPEPSPRPQTAPTRREDAKEEKRLEQATLVAAAVARWKNLMGKDLSASKYMDNTNGHTDGQFRKTGPSRKTQGSLVQSNGLDWGAYEPSAKPAPVEESFEAIGESEDAGGNEPVERRRPLAAPRKVAPRKTRPSTAPAQPIYQPKPFTDLVRLQRPHVTKTDTRSPKKAAPYVERLASTQQPAKMKGENMSLKAKQRLYGTTRIPGSLRQPQKRASPRRVKTYAQRLQEMKQNSRQYSTPITPRSRTQPGSYTAARTPSLMQDVTRRGISQSKGTKHKPLSYTERLQQLQPQRPPSTSRDVVSRQSTVGLHHHGPAHAPKTYTQQLQELQQGAAPTATYKQAYGRPQSSLYETPPARSLARSRPYTSPYDNDLSVSFSVSGRPQSSLYETPPARSLARSRPYTSPYDNDLSDDSLLESPWKVDDDVRRILYNNGDSVADISARDTGNVSELDYLEGDDYTSAVDVKDLSPLSASSGSIMSYIDWDAVENLIADVR